MGASTCLWCGAHASGFLDKAGMYPKRFFSQGHHRVYIQNESKHQIFPGDIIGRLNTTRLDHATCRGASCRSNETQASGSGDSEESTVWTEFVAETLLPTNHGKFRLRGYRHTVRGAWLLARSLAFSSCLDGSSPII